MGTIGASSLVAAGLASLLHVVAGRTLGADGYAHFLVVWGLFFTITGILPGLQQEVVRTVAAARPLDQRQQRPVVGTVIVGLTGLFLILATGPIWAPRLLATQGTRVAGIMGLAFFVYAWANHVNGTLAATHRWSWYARAILIDGVLRFVFVSVALVMHAGYLGWALGLVGPAVTWALLAASSEVRTSTFSIGDASTLAFVRRSGHSMLSAGCSAAVVAGFPVLLWLFGGEKSGGTAAGTLLAVLMSTRAPLLLFLNAYQGVAITRLVDDVAPHRLMARWIGKGLLTSIPLASAGFFIGPSLLRLVFGSEYMASGTTFVELVMSGFVLGIVTLTGWTALSVARHVWFVGGWLATVVATSLLLAVPISLTGRVSLALLVGPLAGASVHLIGIRSHLRSHMRSEKTMHSRIARTNLTGGPPEGATIEVNQTECEELDSGT